MKTLYLYLRDFSCEETEEEVLYTGTVGWYIQGEEGEESIEGESHIVDLQSHLEEYREGTRFNATVLFLDDSYTLFVRESVPGRSVPQIRRALPFAVENYLSDDLENTHIAHGSISRGSDVDCIAINSELLANILQALKLSDVYPTVCTTFGMQIPRPEEEHDVHIVMDNNSAWIRTTEQLAVVNRDTLADAVNLISGNREPVPTIKIWNFGDGDTDFYDESMYEPELFDNRGMSFVSFALEQYSANDCVNLLQGKHSSKENATVNVRRWVMTGVFGLVCLYAYIAIQAAEGVWAMFKVNAVQDEMKAQFVEIYEEQPRGSNIAQQMRTRLGVAGDATREFDVLIERLAEVVSSPAHSPLIKSIRYSAVLQELSVEYRISDLEAMEDFIDSLKSNNKFTVTPGNAQIETETSVLASLKVSLK
ncbi:MAG: hypothetical protein F4Z14_03040 [Gammaproteobacteria bacterium]|nr:hypothetical protein [Gammaproteobacteria bacterium]